MIGSPLGIAIVLFIVSCSTVSHKYQSLRKRPIFVFAKLLNLLEIMTFVEINFIIGTKIRLFDLIMLHLCYAT